MPGYAIVLSIIAAFVLGGIIGVAVGCLLYTSRQHHAVWGEALDDHLDEPQQQVQPEGKEPQLICAVPAIHKARQRVPDHQDSPLSKNTALIKV